MDRKTDRGTNESGSVGDYTLYCHLFPNGKRYIGITRTDPEKRWRSGKGYETQEKMARAISHYGWDNINHQIIAEGLTREQAERLETYLIDALDTVAEGYNVSIGGNHVNGSYLNQHVLEMIRQSKYQDQREGTKQQPDDIVSFAESGNGNSERAAVINHIDEYLQNNRPEWDSGRLSERVDGYWCCFWQMAVYGEIKKSAPAIRYAYLMKCANTLEEALLF